jgi:KTSC domain
MNRGKVKSSSIESIGYDLTTLTLEIEFKPKKGYKTGAVYQYKPFTPLAWDAFVESKSAGMHFDQHIKGKYQHTKISDAVEKTEEDYAKDSAVDLG